MLLLNLLFLNCMNLHFDLLEGEVSHLKTEFTMCVQDDFVCLQLVLS